MTTTDFRDRLYELYRPPSDRFTFVDVPDMQFAMIDGHGNPEGEAFAQAIKWLFTVIYPIKLDTKKRLGKRFVEPPLECLWWADDVTDLITGNKDKLKWRLMIVLPHWTDDTLFAQGVETAIERLGEKPASLQRGILTEGRSVQILHKGPYEDLRNVCAKLHQEFLPEHSLKPNGHHHEIYLNDPTRTAPEKRKTVIRQPVI
ncbi:GyrI-like domain-containing protein [Pseudovibrio sp. WM33]|uniref:GyrI-like domain-containing protein n=1 Tax=Pseudovibrio sp. WM33 TaxID=1735585 RepID=UPI0007AE78D3|nr:GyrI-like domain-containing protein [Pseudovibrio sp. WM33]KZL20378.1 Bacterial transcription activator, effector binding domain [Pseudovibrio sp. WM33]